MKFIDKTQIVFFAFILVSILLFNIINPISLYLDEQVYIECGLKYLTLISPYLCNFEHPPFAKYIIGLSFYLGFSRYLLSAIYAGSAILTHCLCKRIGYREASYLCGSLLLFDTLFYNTYRFHLLDPYAVFFSLLALYLFFANKFYASAVVMGLAVASKFSSIPIFLGSLVFTYCGKGFKWMLRYLPIVLIVYVLTYIMDFALGIDTVFKHHVEMYRYMSWKHGFSLPIALNGLLKLFTRTEYWVIPGELTISMNITNSIISVNETYKPLNGRYVVIGVGIGSFLWYLLFPFLLYTTYIVMTSKSGKNLYAIVLLSWFSSLNILAGPIDWYYINVLPFLYANLSIAIYGLTGVKFRLVNILLVTMQILLFLFTALGLIPFKVIFIK